MFTRTTSVAATLSLVTVNEVNVPITAAALNNVIAPLVLLSVTPVVVFAPAAIREHHFET